ncbi:hypothetical protein [Micromonospora inaquosa]|uniref:Uncharacterized protein n=1 Tax=Micromonospora inaquosa TaxID=2203716 RepID=A0A3N9WPS9_9ACTN|nr:hypothetical protein [Micromonospora inaquosa]RQX02975.1 hypothetical protein DLJ59_13475 [Micromonospora inaquosa]
MTVVGLLGSVSGTVAADHGLFLVLDKRADDIGDPDFSQDRICWSGRDALFVASPSSATCRASVTVQAWDGEPAAVDSTTWPDTDSTEVTLRTGTVYLSHLLDMAPVSDLLPVGPPGRYRVRVDVAGRARTRALLRSPDFDPVRRTVGPERIVIGFWPAR